MTSFVLCCASYHQIKKNFLDEVKNFLTDSGAIIEDITPLCEQDLFAVDISLKLSRPREEIKLHLMALSDKHQVDMALITKNHYRHQRRLIVFDMDSTLIQHEVIDEMAKFFGVENKVKDITTRAMNGELDFNQALRERVLLLKGLKKEALHQILKDLKLTPGAEKLIREVKARHYKTAIISGGFKFFADHFKESLGLDYAFANDLEWDEQEELTGNVRGEIINAQKKAKILEELAQKENISLEQVVAVGDGANDLLMLSRAGLGIAFHAKEVVKNIASYHVSHGPLSILLYFLGIPGNHLEDYI